MVGGIGIVALLVLLGLSLAITRLEAIALTNTGLSSEAARFQARSVFTGTGFTTSWPEKVVDPMWPVTGHTSEPGRTAAARWPSSSDGSAEVGAIERREEAARGRGPHPARGGSTCPRTAAQNV